MKSLKILIVIVILLSLNACSSKKANSNETTEKVVETNLKSEKEMSEAGFQKASIVYYEQQTAPCNYLVELEAGKVLLEPQNELDTEFKVAKSLVWVKYRPQRRMSRCGNSQPAEIIGLESRN